MGKLLEDELAQAKTGLRVVVRLVLLAEVVKAQLFVLETRHTRVKMIYDKTTDACYNYMTIDAARPCHLHIGVLHGVLLSLFIGFYPHRSLPFCPALVHPSYLRAKGIRKPLNNALA